jgi:hypothetical protein
MEPSDLNRFWVHSPGISEQINVCFHWLGACPRLLVPMPFVVYDPYSLFLLTYVSKSVDFVLTSGVNDLHRFSIPFSV